MGGRVTLGIFIVIGILGSGLAITWIMKSRAAQDRAYCANNLRELSLFAGGFADPLNPDRPGVTLAAVPAGTITNPALPPQDRISWVPAMLMLFNQRRQATEEFMSMVDPSLPWHEGKNAELAHKPLFVLMCPASPAEKTHDGYFQTQYLGISGLDPGGADLPLDQPLSPRAGCFRYASATPLALISQYDGLSQSILFAETQRNIGPWMQGGPTTVRGCDDSEDAPAIVGTNGQFGGLHPEGANCAMADGSMRVFTPQVNPRVFRALCTIAGGANEVTPD